MVALPALVLPPQEISSNENGDGKDNCEGNCQFPADYACTPLVVQSRCLRACCLCSICFCTTTIGRRCSKAGDASQETRQVERRWPSLNSGGAIFFSSSD